MSETNQTVDGIEVMKAFVPDSPMVRHLGIRLDELSDDSATLSMPYVDHLATIGTTVHGGAIATLADTTVMATAWASTDVPSPLRGSTVDLTVHYLSPADGADLVARGRVLRRGRSLVHVAVDVATADGAPVAHAVATYKLG
jgi:uncharacterized protein (TIGR00369 family)